MWLPLDVHTASPDLMTTILHSNALNVLLAVVVLGLIAKKMNLGNALGQQQTKLATAVQQMEQQKHQTQLALNQLKQRSEVLHREIDQILSEARQNADKLAQQIVSQAEHEAARIRQQAQAQQEHMLRQAKTQVQQQFMQDVLNDTEQQLKQRVGQIDPHQAIDHFIHALPMVASQVK
jgi:F0F1-type ATP synthase membrane subunit b/b'